LVLVEGIKLEKASNETSNWCQAAGRGTGRGRKSIPMEKKGPLERFLKLTALRRAEGGDGDSKRYESPTDQSFLPIRNYGERKRSHRRGEARQRKKWGEPEGSQRGRASRKDCKKMTNGHKGISKKKQGESEGEEKE